FPLVGRSGDERWVELTVNLLDAGGEVTGFLGFLRDISDRKAAEAALAAERNLLRTVIDLIPDPIYVKDTESRFMLANTALTRLAGRKHPEALIGLSDFDIAPPELAAGYYEDERRLLASGEPLVQHEEAYRTLDGEDHWSLTSKVPLRDAHGRIVGLVGLSHEINERRAVEHALHDEHAEREVQVAERTAE